MREEMERARRALESGSFEEAFALCRDAGPAVEQQPGALALLTHKSSGRPLEAERLRLGACALFGLGHVHQAADWVQKYGLIRPDAHYRYMLALLHLHAREPDQALLEWTRILGEHPSETLADRLIEKLRSGEAGLLRDLLRPGSLWEFLPAPTVARLASTWSLPAAVRLPPLAKRALLLVFALVVGGVALGWTWRSLSLRLPWPARTDPYARLEDRLPGPPEGGTVNLSPGAVTAGAQYKTRDEVAADLRRARALIVEGKPNRARVLLGRIEGSNASFELKERARLLRDMIPSVPRADFRDPFTRVEAQRQAGDFRGGDVLWQGVVAPVVRLARRGFLLEGGRSGPAVVVLLPADYQATEPRPGESWEVFGAFLGLDARERLVVQARELRPLQSAVK